jgi:eukaryotic-like serine/threonine-protein kinase
MSLVSGTKLGPYEIVSPLGAGGMGEVYRARDTKLQRDVALKILPETMARDAQRMARFEREAQVLAALEDENTTSLTPSTREANWPILQSKGRRTGTNEVNLCGGWSI